MTQFTKSERTAIDAAFYAISDLCDCTNWSDAPALKAALKLERQQVGDTTAARAMVCAAWSRGASNADVAAREIFHLRPGYLAALMLGVSHAVERAANDYTGPKVSAARALCVDAAAANDAHTARIVEA